MQLKVSAGFLTVLQLGMSAVAGDERSAQLISAISSCLTIRHAGPHSPGPVVVSLTPRQQECNSATTSAGSTETVSEPNQPAGWFTLILKCVPVE